MTTALPGVPVQFKNRNPYINEEMNVNRPAAPTLVAESSSAAPVYVTPMATEAASVEERAATEVAASSAAPEHEADSEPDPTNESTPSAAVDGQKLTEESTPAEAPEPTKEAEEVVNGGTHPIPPWIPDSKQEDADRLVLMQILWIFNWLDSIFTNSVYDLALYLRSDDEFLFDLFCVLS